MPYSTILALMQIPKISRKTISYVFKNIKNTELTRKEIIDIFREASIKNRRIVIPSEMDFEKAKYKAECIIEESEKNNIKMIDFLDKKFPSRLKNISDPPVLLFYKGNIECIFEKKSVAIIGTRKPTEHGIKVAERLGYIYGKDGFTVISGLAIGCDQFGHIGCLNAGGKTVAILANGLNTVYPAKNKSLAEKILENNGCLLSEYPIGSRIFKNYFIERDRLQSALSSATIIVETGIKGGTMHTAEYTIDQKRILACYKHPEKYLNNKQCDGNLKLINERKAMSLANENDINKLKDMIIKLDLNNINNKYEEGTQLNLFSNI